MRSSLGENRNSENLSEITATVICNKVAKGASVITEPFTLTDF